MFFLYAWIYIQVILESFPVSSSGHTALLNLFCNQGLNLSMGLDAWIIDFLLHAPMIIILMIFFFKSWWSMIVRLPLSLRSFFVQSCWINITKTAVFLGVVDGITFLFWWLKILPDWRLTLGFCCTAGILYSLKYTANGKRDFDWKLKDALSLGLVQGVSLLPGISRFASTYAWGCFLGYNRCVAFSLSFLIQMPLLLGAFVKGLIGLQPHVDVFYKLLDFKLLFVMVSATIISYLALCAMQWLIDRNKLWYFAWYMIIPIGFSFLL